MYVDKINGDYSEERQMMDIIIPETDKTELNAALIIHGGGWFAGDKSGHEGDLLRYSNPSHPSGGLITASMNYRMLDNQGADSYEDMLTDITNALLKMKQVAFECDKSIKKVFLTGESAGAHLSLLYTLKNQKTSPIEIAFAASRCGPTVFANYEYYVKSEDVFGLSIGTLIGYLIGDKVEITLENAEDYTDKLAAVSPVSYVNEASPPLILAHGAVDTLVPVINAHKMNEEYTKHGKQQEIKVFIFPNSGHELGRDPDKNEEYYKEINNYIEKYFA